MPDAHGVQATERKHTHGCAAAVEHKHSGTRQLEHRQAPRAQALDKLQAGSGGAACCHSPRVVHSVGLRQHHELIPQRPLRARSPPTRFPRPYPPPTPQQQPRAHAPLREPPGFPTGHTTTTTMCLCPQGPRWPQTVEGEETKSRELCPGLKAGLPRFAGGREGWEGRGGAARRG